MKRDNRYYCSIFGFKDIDLSNGMVPEDIFGKRDFVELIKKNRYERMRRRRFIGNCIPGSLKGKNIIIIVV